jgi:hypothetical protein
MTLSVAQNINRRMEKWLYEQHFINGVESSSSSSSTICGT